MKNFSEQFLLQDNNSKPDSLFKDDWQEKLYITIHNFLNQKKWLFNDLNSSKKKELIKYLIEQGAFNQKKAADYIAEVLKMGRATIFNYLKEYK